MHDVTIRLKNTPGALADMGEALGRAGVSVEGGGGFVVGGAGVMHFLFKDGLAARKVLEAAKIEVLEVREVLAQRLRQETPGQLGMIARRMADAGVNIEVVYSDHENQLILVVDDAAKGGAVSRAWESERRRGTASIAPWLSVADAARAVEFYKSAFGAEVKERVQGERGVVEVARLAVRGAEFWVQRDGVDKMASRMILSVDDPDSLFRKAISAGASELVPVHEDHGWRVGRIVDPFGHHWEIGKPLG